MKKDRRDGRCYLVEPNIGRPIGRLAIAEAGGVPLLYTMSCDAIGRPLSPCPRSDHVLRAAHHLFERDRLVTALYQKQLAARPELEWLEIDRRESSEQVANRAYLPYFRHLTDHIHRVEK